jgi:hypothetical protein
LTSKHALPTDLFVGVHMTRPFIIKGVFMRVVAADIIKGVFVRVAAADLASLTGPGLVRPGHGRPPSGVCLPAQGEPG